MSSLELEVAPRATESCGAHQICPVDVVVDGASRAVAGGDVAASIWQDVLKNCDLYIPFLTTNDKNYLLRRRHYASTICTNYMLLRFTSSTSYYYYTSYLFYDY